MIHFVCNGNMKNTMEVTLTHKLLRLNLFNINSKPWHNAWLMLKKTVSLQSLHFRLCQAKHNKTQHFHGKMMRLSHKYTGCILLVTIFQTNTLIKYFFITITYQFNIITFPLTKQSGFIQKRFYMSINSNKSCYQ